MQRMRSVAVVGVLGALAVAGCSAGSSGGSGTGGLSTTPSFAPSAATTVQSATTTANPTSSWPTYHRTNDRDGDLGASAATVRTPLRKAWGRALYGAVYGSPIIVGGDVIVGTEKDAVYALNPTTGATIWVRHLGTPEPKSDLPCGNIDPLGITGTPAYDAATGSIFVVTETTGGVHTLWALSAAGKGATRWRVGLDVLSNRNRLAEQERAAITIADSRVDVTFGGLAGDCSNYVGYVTSIVTSGHGSLLHYAVPTAREGGMWTPGGLTVNPANGQLYGAVGNGAATSSSASYDYSDSITELSPTSLARENVFAPSSWADDNANDYDLGSNSPAVVTGGDLVIAGKRGIAYLVKPTLGGIGHQLASLSGCRAFGGDAVRGTTVYLPCTSGLRALHVSGSSLSWGWSASSAITGSPVLAGGDLYSLEPSSGVFDVLSLSTGKTIASLNLGVPATRFATMAVAANGSEVFVPTTTGVVAVS